MDGCCYVCRWANDCEVLVIPDEVVDLIVLARQAIDIADEEITRVHSLIPGSPEWECPSDPCPFCTVMTDLELAIMNVEDFYGVYNVRSKNYPSRP